MIQVNRIYLIFNRLVTKKFLVDTSGAVIVIKGKQQRTSDRADLLFFKEKMFFIIFKVEIWLIVKKICGQM